MDWEYKWYKIKNQDAYKIVLFRVFSYNNFNNIFDTDDLNSKLKQYLKICKISFDFSF